MGVRKTVRYSSFLSGLDLSTATRKERERERERESQGEQEFCINTLPRNLDKGKGQEKLIPLVEYCKFQIKYFGRGQLLRYLDKVKHGFTKSKLSLHINV